MKAAETHQHTCFDSREGRRNLISLDFGGEGDRSCSACSADRPWISEFAGMASETVASVVDREEAGAAVSAGRLESILLAARTAAPMDPLSEFISGLTPHTEAPRRSPGAWSSPALAAAAAAVFVAILVPAIFRESRKPLQPGSGESTQNLRAGRAVPAERAEASSPAADVQMVGSSTESGLVSKREPGVAGNSREKSPANPVGNAEAANRTAEHSAMNGVSVDFRLEKRDDGVYLSWSGDPLQKFLVSRCPISPRGPMCGRGESVEGTSWVDRASTDDTLIVYRVARAT